MTYLRRPLLWNPNFGVLYAYASPNERGQLGLIATFGGGEIGPSIGASINLVNDNGNLSSWDLTPLINGTHVPTENEWGDYLRVRNYNATESLWTATGYTLQGGSSTNYIEPRLFVFGISTPPPSQPSASMVTDSTSFSLPNKITYLSYGIKTEYAIGLKKSNLFIYGGYGK